MPKSSPLLPPKKFLPHRKRIVISNSEKKAQGKYGEEKALAFLLNNGYTILEQNFQKGYGEIDIIALDGNVLVFVEVKSRWSDEFGRPEEAITPWKIRALVRSANYYKMLHPELPDLLRIDVVAIEINQDKTIKRIELIKNITG